MIDMKIEWVEKLEDDSCPYVEEGDVVELNSGRKFMIIYDGEYIFFDLDMHMVYDKWDDVKWIKIGSQINYDGYVTKIWTNQKIS